MTAPDPRVNEIEARLSADWEASMSGGYIGDDQCMKDRDFLLAELRKAREAERAASLLISDLADPDDCHFDHHGGCQAHGYLDLQPGEQCPQFEAKAWVRRAAVAAANGDGEDA